MPCVSVIIPAFKSPDYLNQALASVAGQSFTDLEIIVVDDGSGDECVSQYRLPPSARLIRLPRPHGGAAVARNTGLEAARGQYLALLDQDDVWLPEKLERQVAVMTAHPEIGVTYCHFSMVDESLRPLEEQGKFWPPGRDPLRQVLSGRPLMNPSTMLVRREVLDACGLFDVRVFCVSDRDLALRIASKFPLHGDPSPLVLRREHAGQVSRERLSMRKGQAAVMLKTIGWIARERPDLLPLARRRLGRSLRRLAKAYAAQRDMRPALRLALEAIRAWPWDPQSYGAVLLAFLRRRGRGGASKESGDLLGELLCK